jgi:multidrug efflux pump subunit AcrA (membrane-fusion protein)
LEITESGTIESSGNTEVRCEVKAKNTSGTAILKVVPEGTQVKKGDFLVALDASALDSEKVQQQILANTSEALMVQARNDYETALIAKQEYLEGTFKQEKEIIESEVFVAEENVRRAEEYLQYSQRLAVRGYVTNLQLEADKFAVEKAKKELEAATTKLDVLTRFTRAKMLKQLESDIVSKKAKWEAEKSSYELEVSKLRDIEDQITKCTITAPSDGQVTYAHKYDYRGTSDVVIEPGAIVREGQVIIRLPDPAQMQVKLEVNESVVDRIRPGLPASIRPVGRDEITLAGEVTRVNEYSEPTSRWEGNIKNYATFVAINESHPLLRVGMTAEVTVHCLEIPEVLQIPVQAVYAHGPQLKYCFVRQSTGWDQREVTLGPTNNSFVVIEQGLSEGDVVSLNPKRLVDTAQLPPLVGDERQQAVRTGPRHPEARGPEKMEVAESRERERPAGGSLAGALQALDRDGDGTITREELPGPMQAHFATVDVNGDGTLDQGELTAAIARFSAVGSAFGELPPGGGPPNGDTAAPSRGAETGG